MLGELPCAIEAAVATLIADLGRDPAVYRESVAHVRRLGENIGTLLRLALNQEGSRNVPLDLGDTLMNAVPRWQERALRHGFELALHGDIPTVLADTAHVEQIVDRLLEASVRLLPERGTIHVSVRPVEEGVEIAVRLTGGEKLPSALIVTLFEAVTFGEAWSRLPHPNSALDLTVARILMEALGGRARAEPLASGGGIGMATIFPLVARHQLAANGALHVAATAPTAMAARPAVPLALERERRVVLVVERDGRMARYLKANLEAQGYRVATTGDAAEARRLADLEAPDLLLLDGEPQGSPEAEEFALLRELSADAACPIIVLARHADPLACARALDAGAVDWLARPFSTEELFARIRVALRASEAARPTRDAPSLTYGELAIDLGQRLVTVGGRVVSLSKTEFKLLRALAQHPGMVLSHDVLLERVWGPGYADAVEFVWVYVRRLRRKIEPDPARPRYILTIPGVGYRLARG